MKHLLNFEPPVKFRKGSSLMFKTIVCLIYAIPLFLATGMAFDYVELETMIRQLGAASDLVEKRHVEFAKKLGETRAETQELATDERRLFGYHRTLAGLSFSWTSLLGVLERVVPDGISLLRIRIKPQSVVKIALEGQATSLEQVTCLLRRFYTLERFSDPRLSRHVREESPAGPLVAFTLTVDYLPDLEVRP
ncbi:MAG: PilN domain-containing protein [Candidatus Riflebacteria bacterium]|nr:PilN domain-containing protein [Candidatus Riflebacteria bacterium]